MHGMGKEQTKVWKRDGVGIEGEDGARWRGQKRRGHGESGGQGREDGFSIINK
jgi:hypothetical protein